MDDHPLAIFAFAIVVGALIAVKAWQNCLGNVEAWVDQNPLGAVLRLLLLALLALMVGMLVGIYAGPDPVQAFECVALPDQAVATIRCVVFE